jgi:hypothetical protein
MAFPWQWQAEMSRALLVINNPAIRERAHDLLSKVPFGTRVEFKATKRSLPQNSRFWAMLSDVAAQVEWHGLKLRPTDWRLIFLDALKREARIVPNIDGDGFVNLGRSSRDLSKGEMGDLITLIEMFGAKHGVKFNDGVDSDVLDSNETDAIDRASP